MYPDVTALTKILGSAPFVVAEDAKQTIFKYLYSGIDEKTTVAEFAVNTDDETSAKSAVAAVIVSNWAPDEADDLAVSICPFDPAEILDLDDPLKDKISPFALVGFKLISYCVGIMST